jgi:hypothetical protein
VRKTGRKKGSKAGKKAGGNPQTPTYLSEKYRRAGFLLTNLRVVFLSNSSTFTEKPGR